MPVGQPARLLLHIRQPSSRFRWGCRSTGRQPV